MKEDSGALSRKDIHLKSQRGVKWISVDEDRMELEKTFGYMGLWTYFMGVLFFSSESDFSLLVAAEVIFILGLVSFTFMYKY